jgi:SAM-dependent methyltransferase
MAQAQAQLDRSNAAFWDELCGTTLAKQLGVDDDSPESLAKFDRYYLDLYPYLEDYLPEKAPGDERLLEIGLGYGTVSQILASRGFDYNGLDIAPGPVEMVRHRLRLLGVDAAEGRVQVGSVLVAPHPDESFDHIITIGCLHHTGDLAGAIGEVHRMLRPGGRAVIMVYNRNAWRRMKMAAKSLPTRLRGRGEDDEEMRGAYDRNVEGEAAPATEYASVRDARKLLSDFSKVRVRKENFDGSPLLPKLLPRERMLGWPAHRAGLDLYITATK